MSELSITLFGSMQVTVSGQPVNAFESDKARALLAFLAVEADQPHRREKLAALLWPEMPESTARGNLRHALANLRRLTHDQTAAPPYFFITHQTLQFNAKSDHILDVTAFSKSQMSDQRTNRATVEHLEESLARYREDFLAGFSIADSIVFEEWMLVRREQYRRQACKWLSWLANVYEQRGQYEQALAFTRKQVALNPWDEAVHRQLIRLLALNDQRGAALAHYEICRKTLSAELGVVPTRTTTALYEQIRDEAWPDEIAKIPLPLFVVEETAVSPPSLFVAREQELKQLNSFLNQAQSSKSRVAFITGEAGSGKTTLMHAFAQEAMSRQPNLLVVGGKCSAYSGSGDPYLPFLEIMQMLSGDVESNWEAGDISSEHARRLWSALPEVTEVLVSNGNLLLDRFVSSAALLTRAQVRTRSRLPSDVPWLAQLAEHVQAGEMMATFSQTNLFEQFAGLLETLARRYPLLLLLDDLQWIDNGSLNLLFHLGQHLHGRRILILGAYRPSDVTHSRDGTRHPLLGVVNELQQNFGFNQVDLGRAGGRPFIDALIDSEPNRLNDKFRQVLLQQTGGQALFTTELLRGLQERGDLIKDESGHWVESTQLDWEILPARVEAVIAGRIGRLSDSSRKALTIASIEGEAFTAEVIAHIQQTDEQEIVRRLSGDLSRQHRLVTPQSSQRVGQQRLSRYRFHHFLIQNYLYNDLDVVERADLHAAVGDTLEKLYGTQETTLAAMFGQLAWHFQEAGELEKAIAYCQKAGERAWQLSAASEAISHFRQGLVLLEKLPDSPERKERELNLQMSLVMPLQAAKGFAAPEFHNTCDRAYLLSQQVGQTQQLIIILSALGSYYLTSGQYRVGLKLSQQKLELAQRFQDDLQIALARLGLAANYTLLGEFVKSHEQIEKLLEFYDFRQHHTLAADHTVDPGVNGLIWAALVLWVQGYPDQAERRSQEAVDLARVLDHPLTLTAALEVAAGIMHILSRNTQAARADITESLRLANAHKFGLFQVEGAFYEGFFLVDAGCTVEGLTQMKASLAGWRVTGMRILYSQMLGLLAQALGQAGQVEEGLQTLDEAFAEVNDRDERFFVAELYRIKGHLWQQCGGDTAVSETAYQQAITLARRQRAKSWELKATIGLAKLWQKQGKASQARQVLSKIFDWFTEGFDTPDLQEALALLVELRE